MAKWISKLAPRLLVLSVLMSHLLWQVPLAHAATFTVINLDDSGAGSLRQAITDANAAGGADTVSFSIAGTITLLSELPAITEDLTLDATSVTQSGPNIVLSASGRAYGLSFTGGGSHEVWGIGVTGANDCIKVASVTSINIGGASSEKDITVNGCSGSGIKLSSGSNIAVKNALIGTSSANGHGIEIQSSASSVTIGGTSSVERVVSSGNTLNGINVGGASSVTIQGSYIGTNAAGTGTQANGNDGIYIGTSASNITIGGSSTGAGNVISGNTSHGIELNSNSVTVKGNYIGTNATGTGALANGGSGIKVQSASNVIGGSSSTERNVISGNGSSGIFIDATLRNADSNSIRNNYIGIKADDSGALANASDGVTINGGSAISTTIGGESLGNVISGNGGYGIFINGSGHTGTQILGNTIGLNAAGISAVANSLGGIKTTAASTTIGIANTNTTRNIISGNGSHGIVLESSSNTVANNYIGTNASGTGSEALANASNGIVIQNAGASNTIGGTATGAANTIYQKNAGIAIEVVSTAGNYNDLRRNTYLNPILATVIVLRGGTANESLADPSVSSATHTSPSAIHVMGTAPASTTVDIYVDGTYNSETTASVAGVVDASITQTGGSTLTLLATNGSLSSSSLAGVAPIVNDSIAPNAPTVSYSNNVDLNTSTSATITGTGEALTNVYSNGVDTGVDVDVSGNYSFSVSLLEGSNTFAVTLLDGMSNVSSGTTATITGYRGGVGGFISIFSSSSSSSSDSEETSSVEENPVQDLSDVEQSTVDTSVNTEESISMAGDTEVVSEATSEDSNTTNTTDEQTNSTPTQPIKVTPIVVSSPRDNLPEEPAAPSKFDDALINSDVLGESTNIYGIPNALVDVKLDDGQKLNQDSDGDGLLNWEEIMYGGNPNVWDTDSDGVNDAKEVYVNGTNPESYDSDADGLADAVDSEPLIYNSPKERTSEATVNAYVEEAGLTSYPGLVDSDADGLADLLELYLGTEPQSADSDADGLSDGDEYNNYGTNPLKNTPASDSGVMRVVNVKDQESTGEGQQFYMGHALPNETVQLYDLSSKEPILLGETEADETGRFNLFTEEDLSAGTHTLIAVAGSLEKPRDVSSTFTVHVMDYVKRPEYVSLSLKENMKITDPQPTLDLKAEDNYMIVVSWRSTIYTQTFIADENNSMVYASPWESLDPGSHTVTWYAVDLDKNQKSNPTQIAFNIVEAAFIRGQTASNTMTIILGSLLALASVTALGLYLSRPKSNATKNSK